MMRIGLVLMFLVIHFEFPDKRKLAVGCLAAAGSTDFVDGVAARKLGQVTRLGKVLDPFADKLMVIAALVALYTSHAVGLWMPAALVAKEVCMFAGACYLLGNRVVIPSDVIGKTATFLFVPGTILVYPWHSVSVLRSFGLVILYASGVFSLAAAIHYAGIAVKKLHMRKTD